MHARSHRISEEGTASVISSIPAALKAAVPGSGLLVSYYLIAFHMMMMFYLTLIAVAIFVGKEGKSPSLMAFIILWHLLAIPVWLLRMATLKICRTPIGMLVCFALLVALAVGLQQQLAVALSNLMLWMSTALAELMS